MRDGRCWTRAVRGPFGPRLLRRRAWPAGLAFHRTIAGGRFFVDYTNADGDTEVVGSRSSASADVASPATSGASSPVEQPFANHNGGMLAFGPDGYLYVGLGDGGGRRSAEQRAEPERQAGQDPAHRRRCVSGAAAGQRGGRRSRRAAPRMRNPWRFAFDRATGDLFIGDVGQNRFEEIDVAQAGSGGLNFGWRVMEASQCYQPPDACDRAGSCCRSSSTTTTPAARSPAATSTAVRRCLASSGRYLYADYCSNRVSRSAGRRRGERSCRADVRSRPGRRAPGNHVVRRGRPGELYLTSQGGSVFRIEAE